MAKLRELKPQRFGRCQEGHRVASNHPCFVGDLIQQLRETETM